MLELHPEKQKPRLRKLSRPRKSSTGSFNLAFVGPLHWSVKRFGASDDDKPSCGQSSVNVSRIDGGTNLLRVLEDDNG
jgi:hypothetical protein